MFFLYATYVRDVQVLRRSDVIFSVKTKNVGTFLVSHSDLFTQIHSRPSLFHDSELFPFVKFFWKGQTIIFHSVQVLV